MNRELLEKANNLRRSNQILLADEIYDQLLSIEPNNEEILFNKAFNFFTSDPIKSIKLFEKVVEINPYLIVSYENISILANNNKLFDIAIPIFDKAINLIPNSLDLIYLRATLIGNQGDFISALIDFYNIVDNSSFDNITELFEDSLIAEDIRKVKIFLRSQTQDKIISRPIPNEDKIKQTKIKEYEYTLPSKNLNKNYFIDFGEYMGHSIKKVLENKPDYINWCILNINSFCVSEEIIELLKRKGINISQAENVNLFKLQICREFIPTFYIGEDISD